VRCSVLQCVLQCLLQFVTVCALGARCRLSRQACGGRILYVAHAGESVRVMRAACTQVTDSTHMVRLLKCMSNWGYQVIEDGCEGCVCVMVMGVC